MDTGAQAPGLKMATRFRDCPVTDEIAERNRKTLLNGLTALMGGNEEAFWSIYDPNVVFYEASCLPYGGTHKGLEAAQRAHAQIHQVFSEVRAEFEAILAAEDIVIIYQTINFRVRTNGNSGSFQVAETFRFRNGKVVEWRALYSDACLVSQAIKGS